MGMFMFKEKKRHCGKRLRVTNLPPNTVPHFTHTGPVVLPTKVPSLAVFMALFWLHGGLHCPRRLSVTDPFNFKGTTRSRAVPDR